MLFRKIVATFLVFGTCVQAKPVTAAPDLKERLLSEAPGQWKALDDFIRKLGGTYTQQTRVFPPGSYGSGKTLEPLADMGGRDRSQCRRNGSWIVTEDRLETFSKAGTTVIERVDGRNSRYTFRLVRQSPGGTYLLTGLTRKDPSSQDDFLVWNSRIRRAACNGTLLLSDYMKKPGFILKDVTGEQRDSKSLVRMHYSYTDENERLSVNDGYYLFDPQAYWSVQELGFTSSLGGGVSLLEYGERIEGYPVLRRTVDRYFANDPQKKHWTEYVCEFTDMAHKESPESEFTLSAFGLPEIDPALAKPNNNTWLWIIGLAVVTGLIAVLLRIYTRRKQPVR